MINNTVRMSEFTEITQVDKTTKVVLVQGEPAFNAYIDASLLGGNISGETAARISADTSLSTQISTETFERVSADTSLSTGLSTEMSQRISTDASLTTELGLTTAIAKGAQQALSFQNYYFMVDYFNLWIEEPIDQTTKVGQSIYIRTLDVPDIWISGNIFPSHIPTQYSYISDQKLVDDVNANGGSLQIGFYYISFLETQKVDLTNYVTDTQLSTAILTEESIRLSADQSLSTELTTTTIKNNTDIYTSTDLVNYIITLSQAEYDAIVTKNANTLYVII